MTVTQNYKNAFTEVYTILDYIEDEDYEKIPTEVLEVIEENKNPDYEYEMNEEVDELKKEKPIFQDIQVRWIEESKEVELADSRDYYYVPTIFFEGKKLYEAKPGQNYKTIKECIQNAFETVMRECR